MANVHRAETNESVIASLEAVFAGSWMVFCMLSRHARLRESIEVAIEPFEFYAHFAIMGKLVAFFSARHNIPHTARILSLIAKSRCTRRDTLRISYTFAVLYIPGMVFLSSLVHSPLRSDPIHLEATRRDGCIDII